MGWGWWSLSEEEKKKRLMNVILEVTIEATKRVQWAVNFPYTQSALAQYLDP